MRSYSGSGSYLIEVRPLFWPGPARAARPLRSEEHSAQCDAPALVWLRLLGGEAGRWAAAGVPLDLEPYTSICCLLVRNMVHIRANFNLKGKNHEDEEIKERVVYDIREEWWVNPRSKGKSV